MTDNDEVQTLIVDPDELVFVVYYISAEQFKRHFHTLENHARANKLKKVVHKLQSGEVLKETRLDAVSS